MLDDEMVIVKTRRNLVNLGPAIEVVYRVTPGACLERATEGPVDFPLEPFPVGCYSGYGRVISLAFFIRT